MEDCVSCLWDADKLNAEFQYCTKYSGNTGKPNYENMCVYVEKILKK